MTPIDRPHVQWSSNRPPANTKVVALTRFGIMVVGPITKEEWNCGHIVCWHHCTKKPENWDALLEAAHERRNQERN